MLLHWNSLLYHLLLHYIVCFDVNVAYLYCYYYYYFGMFSPVSEDVVFGLSVHRVRSFVRSSVHILLLPYLTNGLSIHD